MNTAPRMDLPGFSLTFLSLVRVGHRKMPHVPTPEDRLQAFRRFQPVQFANTMFNKEPKQ